MQKSGVSVHTILPNFVDFIVFVGSEAKDTSNIVKSNMSRIRVQRTDRDAWNLIYTSPNAKKVEKLSLVIYAGERVKRVFKDAMEGIKEDVPQLFFDKRRLEFVNSNVTRNDEYEPVAFAEFKNSEVEEFNTLLVSLLELARDNVFVFTDENFFHIINQFVDRNLLEQYGLFKKFEFVPHGEYSERIVKYVSIEKARAYSGGILFMEYANPLLRHNSFKGKFRLVLREKVRKGIRPDMNFRIDDVLEFLGIKMADNDDTAFKKAVSIASIIFDPRIYPVVDFYVDITGIYDAVQIYRGKSKDFYAGFEDFESKLDAFIRFMLRPMSEGGVPPEFEKDVKVLLKDAEAFKREVQRLRKRFLKRKIY